MSPEEFINGRFDIRAAYRGQAVYRVTVKRLNWRPGGIAGSVSFDACTEERPTPREVISTWQIAEGDRHQRCAMPCRHCRLRMRLRRFLFPKELDELREVRI